MSYAPQTLRDLGAYWVAQGGVNLGIVGNQKHCSGYHLGRDRIYGDCACQPKGICVPGKKGSDYSVQYERDQQGLTNAASAIDLGTLDGTLVGLYAFSEWLVARCQAKAPGTDDIREVIYWSVPNQRVQRYSGADGDVHWGPGNGDLSHKTHTHISWWRDSEARDKRPVFAPFFTELPDTGTETDMPYEFKVERWTLDGGPAQVTTVGAPKAADGTVDYSWRLALLSDKGGANPRLELIGRKRLTYVTGDLSDDFYDALTAYAFPADTTPFDQDDIEDAIAADRGKAYVAWRP